MNALPILTPINLVMAPLSCLVAISCFFLSEAAADIQVWSVDATTGPSNHNTETRGGTGLKMAQDGSRALFGAGRQPALPKRVLMLSISKYISISFRPYFDQIPE